jgi:hypothetical protein
LFDTSDYTFAHHCAPLQTLDHKPDNAEFYSVEQRDVVSAFCSDHDERKKANKTSRCVERAHGLIDRIRSRVADSTSRSD